MKKQIKINRTKYLIGDYENIITIILTNKDNLKLEQKTDQIVQIAKNENALLITTCKLKSGGDVKSKNLILSSSGKDLKSKSKRRSNTPSRPLRFSKPKPFLVRRK